MIHSTSISSVPGNLAALLIIGRLLLFQPVEGATFDPSQSGLPVFLSPTGIWLNPSDASKLLYGPTSPSANWHVAQWDIAQDLPAIDHTGIASNRYATVKWLGGGRYELSQDSSAVPCEKSFPSGLTAINENDLLMEPNNASYPSYPQAVVGTQKYTAEFSRVDAGVTLEIRRADATDHECEVSYTTFMYALVLSNHVQQQTLFYQLHLGQFSGTSGGIKKGTMRPHWFFRGNNVQTGRAGVWGFADCITELGRPWAQVRTSQTYQLDLLPRLLWIIKQGDQYGLDQDLTHWQLAGTYHGQNTMGHMRNDAVWSGFSLIATSKHGTTEGRLKGN